MEKDQREALQWFVEFANMDLNGLKLGDKAKLLVESTEHLFPAKHLQAFPPSELFARKMQWAVKAPPQGDSEEYWSLIPQLQVVVREELRQLTEGYGFQEIPGATYDHAEIIPHYKMWADTVIFCSEANPDRFSFTLIPGKTQGDYIRFKLNLLLNGLPRSALNRCLAPIRKKLCGKYFINLSRRKKRFCSLQCLWRFNTIKRREADPEAYREYQKVLMRDRRWEKVGQRRRRTIKTKGMKAE
jgi:hypothetical protein